MRSATTVLKMFSQTELAKLWGCSQATISYKLRHQTVTIKEYQLVIKRHPEFRTVLLDALGG